jgi:diguanylate cyclase (GGDEF)-like protein
VAGALDPAQLAADPELIESVLGLHEALDLRAQLQQLLARVMSWSEARFGFALMAAEERRASSPVASSAGAEDARMVALGRIEPQRLKRWLAAPGFLDGPGPFADTAQPWPEGLPAFSAALPVVGPDGASAALIVLALDARPPVARQERIERLLALARTAVNNALEMRAMRELVIKDDTAHCFNRRHFETCLPDELARASRFQTPLSLIFLDMDNLKEVNKRYGHAMGSRSLNEVSQRIRSKIRRFDKLFRFGGDEFCIVLPQTEWHGALEVAERVRDAIARQPFLEPELGEGQGVRMTASLGISSFPLHARSQKELIEQSDRAMQRIKNATKNSIGIAEISGGEHGR